MTDMPAEEAKALEYRLREVRRFAARVAAELAMRGSQSARRDLGVRWEPLANRNEAPDYRVLP